MTDATLPLIAAVEAAASAEALLLATRQLAAAMHPAVDVEAIACLVEVLGFNNPGAAVAAVDGLIAAGPTAVPPLLHGLDEHNYGARAWAVRALAGIGDVRGLELLEQALGQDIGPSVRRAAARGLGQLQLRDLPLDQADAVRERCLAALETSESDGEWVVRYAISVALESLALALPEDDSRRQRAGAALERLEQDPQDDGLVVRQRAALARRRLGLAHREETP